MKTVFAKTLKPLLMVVGVAVAIYAVAATLAGNMEAQQAQAKEARIRPLASVTTAVAELKPVAYALNATGVLSPLESVEVLSETDGKVVALHFELNQAVKQGEVLAQTDAKTKQIQLATAELNYQKARRDFERLEALYKNNNAAEYDLENARFQMQTAEQNRLLARQELDFCTIKSPIAGTVSQKSAATGTFLQPGSPVARITDISRLRLFVHLAAQDLGHVQVGQKVRVTIPARPGEQFTGTVRSIAVQSTEAGTFPVEIMLTNLPQRPLLAGMHAEVLFAEQAAKEALLIPRTALMGNRVFVVANGKALARNISPGKDRGEAVEALDGLKVGEEVVVKGQQNLEDGQLVQKQ